MSRSEQGKVALDQDAHGAVVMKQRSPFFGDLKEVHNVVSAQIGDCHHYKLKREMRDDVSERKMSTVVHFVRELVGVG